jgi:hypothetical protein
MERKGRRRRGEVCVTLAAQVGVGVVPGVLVVLEHIQTRRLQRQIQTFETYFTSKPLK